VIIPESKDNKGTTQELIEEYGEKLQPWIVVTSGGSMPDNGIIEEIREPIGNIDIV
jgi:hypothetical protein